MNASGDVVEGSGGVVLGGGGAGGMERARWGEDMRSEGQAGRDDCGWSERVSGQDC